MFTNNWWHLKIIFMIYFRPKNILCAKKCWPQSLITTLYKKLHFLHDKFPTYSLQRQKLNQTDWPTNRNNYTTCYEHLISSTATQINAVQTTLRIFFWRNLIKYFIISGVSLWDKEKFKHKNLQPLIRCFYFVRLVFFHPDKVYSCLLFVKSRILSLIFTGINP